jgi:CPA2 family monovalent cation:H+ antiporter-2
MHHVTPLLGIIIGGLVLAFILGAIAHRLRLSPLIGYLLAGIVVGPFTPGYVAHQGLANELAELGVILLMFGVGLHFSVRDLLSVRRVAIPGAIAQILCATLLGWGLGALMGWSIAAGLMFGLSLSTASTVVLLRAVNERRLINTDRGRIAVGWLIVEDIAMVFALVVIPAVYAGAGSAHGLETALALTAVKVAVFVALMLVVGRRFVPWMLHGIIHGGSRELFRLAVLAVALGVAAGAALLFGVSFALGAFFAGMILAESPLSQRAAEETLPLRDAFAVLFFVSVGMLFNPAIVVEAPLALLATLLIIMIGKSLAAYGIVRLFGKSNRTALTIAASLAQIGEFSFILAALGSSLRILPDDARDLILAGAILSIMLNPAAFALVSRLVRDEPPPEEGEPARGRERRGHVVLVGHGRVGSMVVRDLADAGEMAVIETESDVVPQNSDEGPHVIVGNAADPKLLEEARIAEARALLVAIPDSFEAGQIVAQARKLNPGLLIVARAHHEDELEYLARHGANHVIMGEHEIARRMVELVGKP